MTLEYRRRLLSSCKQILCKTFTSFTDQSLLWFATKYSKYLINLSVRGAAPHQLRTTVDIKNKGLCIKPDIMQGVVPADVGLVSVT